MEPPDMSSQSAPHPAEGMSSPMHAASPMAQMGTSLFPQQEEGISLPDGDVSGSHPPGAAMAAYSYVYALGRVEPRFPRLAVEKEFAQATGRAETTGLTDRQALHTVLSQRQNRYLVRQLCYVLTIEGLESYILHPRDPADFDLLPKFCAKIAGVKTIQIASNLAYFLRFEVLETEGCQHDKATRSISHAP